MSKNAGARITIRCGLLSKDVDMDAVVPFKIQGHTLRVCRGVRAQPLFVLEDLCALLGFTHRSHAITQTVLAGSLHLEGGKPLMLINEAALFRLIARSRAPAARLFEQQLCEEILPMIHQQAGCGGASVSRVQLDQLQARIGAICRPFRLTRVAQRSCWAVLRTRFGLQESIRHLPAFRFEEAMGVLEKIAQGTPLLHSRVASLEADFFKALLHTAKSERAASTAPGAPAQAQRRRAQQPAAHRRPQKQRGGLGDVQQR